MIGQKTIQTLDKSLERDLKKELRDQGHYLTGHLERSMQPKIVETTTGVLLEVLAEDYIDDLETGVPSSKIKLDASYIHELATYSRLRFGVSQERAIQIGYAIAKKHKREGNPTFASYQFSNTGERKHAIEISYNQHEQLYEQQIESGLSREIDGFIDKTFDTTIF